MNDVAVLVIVGFSFGCQSFRPSFENPREMRDGVMLGRSYRRCIPPAGAFQIGMRAYDSAKPQVTDMFSLRRKRTGPRPERTPADMGGPVYPRHEDAIEYRGTQLSRAIDDGTVTVAENLLLKADLKPLPRCPECMTAVGSSQRSCHTCGRDLRKML